jgi:hypothetical protein
VVRVEVGDATAGWPGEVKHLAIWSGALPSLPATLMPSASTVQSWVQQLIDWAGVSATATTRGTNRTTVTPAVDGASPVGVMGSLAAGSLARVAVDAAGNPVITSWDYLPTPITGPSGEIDPDVEWVADPDGSPTMVTMTWPDGKVYRAIRSGERPIELPGVLPYAIGASVAEWVIQSGSDAPRISEATYDLATLPVAAAVSLSVLEVGDRLTIDMLPHQRLGQGAAHRDDRRHLHAGRGVGLADRERFQRVAGVKRIAEGIGGAAAPAVGHLSWITLDHALELPLAGGIGASRRQGIDARAPLRVLLGIVDGHQPTLRIVTPLGKPPV